MQIGEVIKKLRKEARMTLQDLSQKSGVALATLSRIENGKMTGTLESHMKICQALNISLPELYKELPSSKKTVEVKTRQVIEKISLNDKKSSAIMLASNVNSKKMLPLLIVVSKGGKTTVEEGSRGSEKFIYILDGKIEATLGENKFTLSAKDTIYFDASQPHYFRNIGTGDAHIISVSCSQTN